MPLSLPQMRIYRAAWAKAAGKLGLTPGTPEAEEERIAIMKEVTGKTSSKQLTNLQLDKCLRAFARVDPQSLHAVNEPEAQTHKRTLWSLRNRFPERYVAEVMKDKFNTTDLDSLNAPQLKQLLMTVEHRWRRLRRNGSA